MLRRKGKKGYTLIEMLITLTLIGIITVTTFAVVNSAMKTFKKQQEIVDAQKIIDIVGERMNDLLNKKSKIILTMTNIDDDVTPSGEIRHADASGTEYSDAGGAYIIDAKLKATNLVYSDVNMGRIYRVEASKEGKCYITKYEKGASNSTSYATSNYPKEPFKNKYGREELFEEMIYKDFNVNISFVPLAKPAQRYTDLQVVIEASKNGRVIRQGVETFHLHNLDYNKTSIEFRNPDGTNVPGKKPYRFCYYA